MADDPQCPSIKLTQTTPQSPNPQTSPFQPQHKPPPWPHKASTKPRPTITPHENQRKHTLNPPPTKTQTKPMITNPTNWPNTKSLPSWCPLWCPYGAPYGVPYFNRTIPYLQTSNPKPNLYTPGAVNKHGARIRGAPLPVGFPVQNHSQNQLRLLPNQCCNPWGNL